MKMDDLNVLKLLMAVDEGVYEEFRHSATTLNVDSVARLHQCGCRRRIDHLLSGCLWPGRGIHQLAGAVPAR
jgi:hypothetical protein